MKYKNTVMGRFVDRPNRFIAHVLIDNVIETVHVKNTGRCRELLIPGVLVVLEKSDNESRKTAYDLVMVHKEGIGWVNIDSQMPNYLVNEWLQNKTEMFSDITFIKPEYKYGDSRIDFYMEGPERKVLMEVKGVTLEREGVCYFPDAPTERGIKHIHELIKAKNDGYETYLAFVIQMNGVSLVKANVGTHKAFGDALDAAIEAGVNVLMLQCFVDSDSIFIVEKNK